MIATGSYGRQGVDQQKTIDLVVVLDIWDYDGGQAAELFSEKS